MFDWKMPSSAALTLATCLALTPAIFAAGPVIETRLFPVVRDVGVIERVVVNDGLRFSLRFRKVRQCQFLGLAWYDGEAPLRVDMNPGEPTRPVTTRTTGWQTVGPWILFGMNRLERTRAVTVHRCHPLWVTITNFYGA